MKFSRKTNYLLIGFLLMLNLAFRYPVTPHEIGHDSFFIHGLANSISTSGDIKWALHPTSLFGLYPMSYPSGFPVALSITSQLTGLDMEIVILIYCFFLAAMGMLGSYVMALKMWDNQLFAFFTSFAFSTAPIFVEYTRWTATSRNLFVVLFPLFLWAVFWFNKKDSYINRQLLLIIILIITLGTAHRLSFLLSIVFASYVLTKSIWYAKDNSHFLKYSARLSENTIFFGFVLLWIMAFSLQFSNIGFYKGIWYDYQTGAFAEGTNLFSILINLSTNYTGHIGILIPFGFIGFVMLMKKCDKSFNEAFIICVVILSTTMLALGLYVSIFLLPFVTILIALCICKLLGLSQCEGGHLDLITALWHSVVTFNKKAPAIIAVVCLVTSICFSCYMINRHMYVTLGDTDENTWMTDDIPAVGLFLKSCGEGTFLSNDILLNRRIYASTSVLAFSHDLFMPLVAGWISKDELKVGYLSLHKFNINTDYIYSLNETPSAYGDIDRIYAENYKSDFSQRVFDRYKINLLVTNVRANDQTICTKSVTNHGRRIYDNGAETIWILRNGAEI